MKVGSRVLVRFVAVDRASTRVILLDPPRPGVVRRLLSSSPGAWVELEERLEDDLHPFPADDATRARHVLVWPGDLA